MELPGGQRGVELPFGQRRVQLPGGQRGVELPGGQRGVQLPGGQRGVNVAYVLRQQNSYLYGPFQFVFYSCPVKTTRPTPGRFVCNGHTCCLEYPQV